MNSVKTTLISINAQNDILKQQIENININISRFGKMLKDDATTQKQYERSHRTGLLFIQKQIAQITPKKTTVAAGTFGIESKKPPLMTR